MSEQEQKQVEDFNEVLEKVEDTDSKNEDLQEFKASMGDPSEVPDPQTSKTDEKPKGKGEPMPKTKMGMIAAAMKKMGDMKKSDVEKMVASMYNPEGKHMKDEGMHGDKKEMTTDKPVQKLAAAVNKEDLDLSDDINALFGDIEDKEFKEKATTMFEAAVVAKVNEQLEKYAASVEADSSNIINEEVTKLSEKVDQYLDYVVNEWVEDNKLAIENGIKAEMTEDFMKGLKRLFNDHYVDLPEEKVDVVEELVSKVEGLEKEVKDLTDKNVELSKTNKDFETKTAFEEQVKDLTDTQADKLKGLVEGIEFSDTKDFVKKVTMLKEQYFKNASDEADNKVINDDDKNPEALSEDANQVPAGMKSYMDVISKQAAKTK